MNTRRLPIYIVVDCSESMVGGPLDSVSLGLDLLANEVQSNPIAMDTAAISVIGFSGKARQLRPLTEAFDFKTPALHVGPGTGLGAALELLTNKVLMEVRRPTDTQQADYRPIVFLLTDGQPTDNWQAGLNYFRSKLPNINLIAIGCGNDVDMKVLKTLTPNAFTISEMTPDKIKSFFQWVSSSITAASVSVQHIGTELTLPPPPAGLLNSAESHSKAAKLTQIILAARCEHNKQPYLMRYRLKGADYVAEGAYPVTIDYFTEASTAAVGEQIQSNQLQGVPACPYCGRSGWKVYEDGNIFCNDRLELGGKRAQIMFVLDITGSMSGEIKGVKDNIVDFVNFIKSDGLDIEVGLIAFRDLEQREPPEILTFEAGPFTKDASGFSSQVAKLHANGGGGNPGESSLDAISLACEQRFDETSERILILITDEPPLIPDGPRVPNMESVLSELSRAKINQIHLVVSDHLQNRYEPLRKRVGKGDFFHLGKGGRGGKSFRDILLGIGKQISITTRQG